ncbi:KDO2-lipid IV(A) lauroyltransferase [Agrobacterium vitis]|nr:KDO2-lipid IV(A) lauroyltransferase [Agrobacterium vitis]MBE1438423.1 KDO2-lipid IV(A) lauroyltransferase [Agrobacterium vitis]
MKRLLRRILTPLVLRFRAFPQWLVAKLLLLLLMVLKVFPADAALNFADRLVRFVGPRLARHHLMLANLRNAFPEKSQAEIEKIAADAWGHMGRQTAEYVFLDKLFDFDPTRLGEGRIDVSGIPIFMELLNTRRPFIVFTAHTGNFEMLPVAGASYGLDVTVLFRPPNNPYIADMVFGFRKERMGNLVPSHAGSAFHLAGQLEAGKGVGVLVDQKFSRGKPTTFFNQNVRTNPLLAKLVRQFGCDVFPARCVRLPGNRYRLEIEPKVELPYDAHGNLDVQATAQLLNDKVESWVREYPEQWLWYHDRWDIKNTLRAS